jgi:hypothetical protein
MRIHKIDQAEKSILVNVRLRESEIETIKANADKYTDGNVSSLLRYVGVYPNLRSKPKFEILRVVKPRKSRQKREVQL